MEEICISPGKAGVIKNGDVNNGTREGSPKNLSPVFRPVTSAKKLKCFQSPEDDFPSYQISRHSKRFSDFSEEQESVLPISPVSTPPSVQKTKDFPEPVVYTLGTIVKKNPSIMNATSEESRDLPHENHKYSVFDNLGIVDKDISWESSMETPAPQQSAMKEFNTLERATLLPENEQKNMQPRALFSPYKNSDIDCMPLKYSSESDGDYDTDEWNNSIKAQVISDPMTDQCQQGSTPKRTGGTCGKEELLSPISPVFRIKTKKTKAKTKKLRQLLVKSPVTVENHTNFDESVKEKDSSLNISGVKRLEVDKSCGSCFSELSNSIQDDSFQNMSFSCIDELCKSSVAASDCDTSSKSHLPTVKEEPDSESGTDFPVTKQGSISGRFFYNDDKSQELKPVMSTGDLLKSAKLLEEADVLGKVSNKVVENQDLTVFKKIINETSSQGVKRGRLDSSFEKTPRAAQKRKMDELQHEMSQFDLNDTQICLTAAYAESLLVNNKENVNTVNFSGDIDMKTDDDETLTNTLVPEESNNSVKQRNVSSVNSEFPVFATASGKAVSITSDALKKVKTMLGEELDESDWSVIDNTNEKDENCFQGFKTASGAAVNVSEKSLQKVQTMFRECGVDCDGANIPVEDVHASDGFVNASGVKDRISAQIANKAGNKLEKMDDDVRKEEWKEEVINKSPVGFKTASSKAITLSKESLKRVKDLWRGEEEINEEFFIAEKASSQRNVMTEDRTDQRTCGELFCGFNTASGKNVPVSEEALKKVKNILGENEEKENEVRKVEFCGFKTASNKNVSISEVALEKARKIIGDDGEVEECRKVKVEEEPPQPPRGKIECQEDSADSAELIPSWLHAYSTSPTLTMDRMNLPAVTSHEDSGQNTTQREEYVIKSPILGTTDRFFNRRKRRRLVFESSPKTVKLDKDIAKPNFVVPYKQGCRRTSSPDLNIDFAVPFKRRKIDVAAEGVTEEVVEGRRKARLQQANAEKKGKVKPTKGSHLLKKKEDQMSWRDAVQGAFPGQYEEDTLRRHGVRDEVLGITIQNAVEYRFTATDFYSSAACASNVNGFPVGDECFLIFNDDQTAGVNEFARAFFASPGVEPKLISEEWVRNHYKWIVWKFSHYERSFPHLFGGRCLTPHNVMVQLKYRYDREIDRSHRSVLKKILERDEPSTKRMVLCVCDIKKTCDLENSHKDSSNKSLISYKLGMTDGWYSCYAQTDAAMTRLVEEGKVAIGVKLVTQGAELLNCEKGVSPLETAENVHLRIFTNSTRRARWDAKLGAQKWGGPLRISLNSVLPNGGLIGRIDVIIVRVYPVLFMEKKPDGTNMTRNSRMEDRAVAAYQRQQETAIEKIYQKARDEMENQSKDNEKVAKNVSLSNISKISDPEELLKLYERCPDPSAFQSLLTREQQENLIDYQHRRHEIKNKELMDMVQERIKAEKMNTRKVSQFLRFKIVDLNKPDYGSPAVFTVWNSTEDVSRLLSEGKAVSIFNVTPGNYRFHKPLQLNTTRQTQYRELSRTVEYPARKVTRLNELAFDCEPIFSEVDIVGIVVLIQESCSGSRTSQTVFLADLDFNFVGIVFWGSCKDYGWENVLTVNSIVACSNLQYVRKRNSIPVVYVNDSSVFTENPKLSYLKDEIKALKSSLTDDKMFISKCEEEIQLRLEDQKNNSNVSRNSNDSGQSLQSSLKPKYINGFKTKPNASSTPFKSFSSVLDVSDQEPSPIQKRIEKLQMYGEPPPLSPLLPMDNLEKFRKQFKVPFKNKTSIDPSSK